MQRLHWLAAPTRVHVLRAQALAFRPAEVRRATGPKQEELAEKPGISQSRVSRILHGDLKQTELATLRASVHAPGPDRPGRCRPVLNGELEVTVKPGRGNVRRVRISQIGVSVQVESVELGEFDQSRWADSVTAERAAVPLERAGDCVSGMRLCR